MRDLVLVSTDDLINELVSRSGDFALVYIRIEEGNKTLLKTEWDCKSTFHAVLGMIEVLKIDIQEAKSKEE